jgi:hypothetical protein
MASIGMNSTAQNAAKEYDLTAPARVVLGFKIHAGENPKPHGRDARTQGVDAREP